MSRRQKCVQDSWKLPQNQEGFFLKHIFYSNKKKKNSVSCPRTLHHVKHGVKSAVDISGKSNIPPDLPPSYTSSDRPCIHMELNGLNPDEAEI